MNLYDLRDTLEQDDLVAVFQRADVEFDADRVTVALDLEEFAEPLTLQITAVETEPGSIEDAELIQLYAPIPLVLNERSLAKVREMLPSINERVPLIGFSVYTEERFVYFRHVMLVPLDAPVAHQLIKEAVWLAYFALDSFAANFAALA